MKKRYIFILIVVTAVIVAFGVSQNTIIQRQQAEIAAFKVQQANDANQVQQLLDEKKDFEFRFNEVLDRLKKNTQAKMTLEFQLENAQALIQKLEEEKKLPDPSVQNVVKDDVVQPVVGVATLQGRLIYWNKPVSRVTNEKPAIEIKDMKTGQEPKNAKVLLTGSKYSIENLPLGKYQVSVRVEVPYKKDRHIPEELKGILTIEVSENGKTIIQDIMME